MEINISYFAQVLAISGIFTGYHYLCLRQNGQHRINRFVLLSSMMLSILLPLINIPIAVNNPLQFALFAERATVLNTSQAEMETTANLATSAINKIGFQQILWLVFGIISSIILLKMLHSLWLIQQKIWRSKVLIQHNHFIIYNENIHQPFSFFKWIFIPVSIQKNEALLNAILLHEDAHVRQWHSIDKLFTNLVKTIFWWNPFFFYLEKQLLLTHEYEADNHAAKRLGTKKYAEILLLHIFPESLSSLSHSFNQSPIKSRIMMLLKTAKQPARYWILIPVIGLSILIFATSFKKTPLPANIEKSLHVVIDAGHGGIDHGAIAANAKEKDFTLSLANALLQKAKGTNINITLTRSTDELPVAGNINESLKKRVTLVQESKADAMVSLHVGATEAHNANPNQGVLAFVAGKNEQSASISKPLAAALLNGLTGGPLQVEPNIQQRKQQGIYILDKNTKPVVLLEVGFISNNQDRAILSNKSNIQLLADRILTGLQQYAENM